MIKPIDSEKMNPVQMALFCTRLHLCCLNGLNVQLPNGEGDNFTLKKLDNSEFISLIDNAEAWFAKYDGKGTLS